MENIIVRNKNVLVEFLEDNASFEKVNLASGLDQDIQTQKIIKLATKQRIPVEELSRYKMEKRRGSDTTEVISGLLRVENNWTLKNLLDDIYKKDQDPFFLFINRIEFPTNIGMIARTAFALGVNGLFFQGKENLFFNEETFHFSMGAIDRIPLVKVGIFEVLKELQKNGIKIFSIQMGGDVYFEEDLLGPIVFVLGDEKAVCYENNEI
ncbi:MAG: TrmH family RNA methyltransferase [Patescibacteria group bacterium]